MKNNYLVVFGKRFFKNLLSITLLQMCLISIAFAQEIDVSGTIKDENSEPLPGVNVVVEGTTTGTVTDMNGQYTITVPGSESHLVFSSIGYVTENILVGGQSVIDLALIPDITALDEIVVVGYGIQKRSSVTGAVSSVSAKEISALPVPSVSGALQGRVPGVLVTNNGGPGSNAIVRIRGIGSITQSADPLYVVDGFPAPNFNLNSVDTKELSLLKF